MREPIGVIPQALTSDMDLTGWENVDLYGGYYNLPRRVRRERAEHLIHMVGLTERANDLVQTYSGGMRRRLKIARGLIHSPQVLFLDEPTIGLDPQSRRAVWELLEQLRRDTGLTISLTTHYMNRRRKRSAIASRSSMAARLSRSAPPAEALKAMVQGSDRIELEVQGDNEKIIAMLRGAPGVHEVTRDSEGPIIVSVDDGAHAMPKIIGDIENAGAIVTSIKLRADVAETSSSSSPASASAMNRRARAVSLG